MFGPARCTPTPQQRKATTAGPTATYTSAAAKPQLQCIAGDVTVHSPAANSPDHSTPKLICASRKAAQLRRISGGSSGCVCCLFLFVLVLVVCFLLFFFGFCCLFSSCVFLLFFLF